MAMPKTALAKVFSPQLVHGKIGSCLQPDPKRQGRSRTAVQRLGFDVR